MNPIPIQDEEKEEKKNIFGWFKLTPGLLEKTYRDFAGFDISFGEVKDLCGKACED